MSMFNLDSDKEDSYVPSHQSPTIIIQDAPLPIHLEEIHSSLAMKKIHLKGIQGFKKKNILLSTILKKYLIPSLSTFMGRKSVIRESKV